MPAIIQANQSIERRIALILFIYGSILLTGSIGYMFLEGWTWLDSLYMTVITITTVGFGEVHSLHPAGQLFTICLVLLGVGGFTYTFGTIADYLVAGELSEFLYRRKTQNMIREMQNHHIVCGFGRVGYQVAKELKRDGKQLIMLEEDPKAVEKARQADFPVIEGNANSDEILRTARIESASGLIATLGTDAANLMLVLSARALNKDLFIVARANYEATEPKLVTAGANRVISPYSIGGRRMAQMVTRPNVVDFLDVVMHDEKLELRLEDIEISTGCKLDSCAIGAARIRETTGANILGLRRPGGQLIVGPTPETVLQAGDTLVALGTIDQLAKLETLGK